MNEPTMGPTEQPPTPAKPPPTVDHEDSAQSGKIIAGKYKLLNVIGEGAWVDSTIRARHRDL